MLVHNYLDLNDDLMQAVIKKTHYAILEHFFSVHDKNFYSRVGWVGATRKPIMYPEGHLHVAKRMVAAHYIFDNH